MSAYREINPDNRGAESRGNCRGRVVTGHRVFLIVNRDLEKTEDKQGNHLPAGLTL